MAVRFTELEGHHPQFVDNVPCSPWEIAQISVNVSCDFVKHIVFSRDCCTLYLIDTYDVDLQTYEILYFV